ncbi:hypothetical protein AB5N19_06869 [Seiridium cardinale]
MDPNQPQAQSQPQAQPQPQYQPYPQQYQQAPRVIPYSRPWQITKIVFHSLSIVFSIIVLGISIALVVDPDVNQSYQIIWVAPQAGIALIWSIAELITICARRGRGIHPGAQVALHLLLWLGFLVAVGLTSWLVAFAQECDYYCREYYYDYNGGQYFSSIQAELAFLALLALVHFILFVRACVETNQRNKMAGPVIMVPQHMYYNQPMAQYPVQSMPPMQQGYPVPPQQAHTSGYYGQPKEAQHQSTGSAPVSQPQAPTAA